MQTCSSTGATSAPTPVRHNLTPGVCARSAHAKHALFDCLPAGAAGVSVVDDQARRESPRLVRWRAGAQVGVQCICRLLLPFMADENDAGFSSRRGAGEVPSGRIC